MKKILWSRNRTLWRSTVSAAKGFSAAVRTQKKVRRVFLTGTVIAALCVLADAGYFQTLMVAFSWVVALICEMFNTALEKALDYASGKEYHPLIRDGKDYASACTFVALIFAGLLSFFTLWERMFR